MDSAQTAYDGAIERNPEHFSSHYNLGTLLLREFNQISQAPIFNGLMN